MKYLSWVLLIFTCIILQSLLNNYLPAYLSPDIALILVTYAVFFLNYYYALIFIIIVSYFSSVFSVGSFWFYLFAYIIVFYILMFLKKLFSRSQLIAIITIGIISTLLYPIPVFVLSNLFQHNGLFITAINSAFQKIPINMLCTYVFFKYLPLIDYRLNAKFTSMKV